MNKKQYQSSYPRYVEIENGHLLNFCGIGCSMEVLGGRWKLLVVTELFKDKKRFAEIKKAIPEISDKVLTESLKTLAYHNIVSRKENSGLVEYRLTEYGATLRPVLEILYTWGEKHIQLHSDKIFV